MASAPAGIPPRQSEARAPARAPELQDALNRYLFHPLSRRLARLLLPTGVSPNAVSIFGLLLLWIATFFYVARPWPEGAAIGFLLHLSWHVADGADGDLARLKGAASPHGELVDGVCDYAGHVVMYIAFAFLLDAQIGGWAWFWAAVAGASHVAQTNHADSQRRTYLWWAYGVPWLKQSKARDDAVFRRQSWFGTLFGWMAAEYIRLSNAMVPANAVVERAIAEAAGDPARTARIRRLVRRSARRSLLFQQALAANPKTVLIGGSMLIGSPLWFFLAEALLLNLVLIASLIHHDRRARRLARALNG
jgi:CDP-alcohol phosphatidyltransferase